MTPAAVGQRHDPSGVAPSLGSSLRADGGPGPPQPQPRTRFRQFPPDQHPQAPSPCEAPASPHTCVCRQTPTVPWPTPVCLTVTVSVGFLEHCEPCQGRRQWKWSPLPRPRGTPCGPHCPIPAGPRASHRLSAGSLSPAMPVRGDSCSCGRNTSTWNRVHLRPRPRAPHPLEAPRWPTWTAHVDGPLSLSPQPAEGIGQGPEAVRGDLGLGPDQPERLHGVLVVRDLRAAEGRRRRLVRPASRGAPGPGAAPQAGVERGILVLPKVECQAGSPRGGGPPRSSYQKENKRTSCQCLKNSDISQNV